MDRNIEAAGSLAAKRAAAALLIFAAFAAALVWLQPDQLYLWIKALHVMSVIAWMAGMFYLPRLFVYHADVEIGSEASELFKVMERRLLRVIINPAMTLAWVFGLLVAVVAATMAITRVCLGCEVYERFRARAS